MTARLIAQQDVFPIDDFAGYIAGNWYFGVGPQSFAAGTALPGGSARFYLAAVRQLVTINALGCRVATTSAGGNVQAAIYANDPTRMRPTGSAIVSGASMSTTAASSVNAAVSAQLTPGLYWFGVNSDNAVASLVAPSATCAFQSQVAGSSNQAFDLAANGGTLSFVSTPLTFGTWGDLTAATWTEVAASVASGVVQFKVASVP